jgi:hypothetical protein
MADYVSKVQVVQDQYDKEGERMQENIKNYKLQKAQTTDDLEMRKLNNILTNQKFIPTKLKDGRYGLTINPNFERLKSEADYSPMFQQENLEVQRILNSDEDDKVKIQMLKNLKNGKRRCHERK